MKLFSGPRAICAALLFAIIAGGYSLVPVQNPISQATCDKIQLAWNLPQVIEFLGENFLASDDSPPVVGWGDEDGNLIWVSFDGTPFVTAKRFVLTELSLFERIKWRVESRLRR